MIKGMHKFKVFLIAIIIQMTFGVSSLTIKKEKDIDKKNNSFDLYLKDYFSYTSEKCL